MNTTEIKVENLKCNGCASTIKKGVEKYEEVKSLEIDIEQSIVKINFDGEDDVIDIFKKKLSSLGYPESGNNNTISVAKSFVSCAVGKINT